MSAIFIRTKIPLKVANFYMVYKNNEANQFNIKQAYVMKTLNISHTKNTKSY